MTTATRWSITPLMVAALTIGTGSMAAAQQPAANATAQPAPAAPTQPATGEWSVTPFVGFGFSGDLDSATGALGVAGGYGWSRKVTLEGEFNLLPSSENGGLVEVSSNAWTLTGNLLYHFTPRAWRPYGAIGLGYGHASVDFDDNTNSVDVLDTSSNEFVVNFGGGVERAINNRVQFRGDLRYFFGGDLVPDYWRLSAGIRFGVGAR
jgi:hypothetical protein